MLTTPPGARRGLVIYPRSAAAVYTLCGPPSSAVAAAAAVFPHYGRAHRGLKINDTLRSGGKGNKQKKRIRRGATAPVFPFYRFLKVTVGLACKVLE